MDAVTILIGLGIVVASVLAIAFVVRILLLRPHLSAVLRKTRQVLHDRDVFAKVYAFTTSTSAQRVIDAIERRWERAVPDGEPGFYVASVIHEQQVILSFGNTDTPGIFSARIDFTSRDPASGTLWFYDAELLSAGTEAAEVFRAEFARLIAEVSPGAELLEHDGEIVIATSGPDPDWRARRGSHRKK
ncbi:MULTISPECIES: hypothetical protein [unclassified Mycobacterium]|uniref:hypothetical protein n=1 Tax=unclassified Mycobacterium TaxID=2642494 RepID=UPI0029C8A6BC|nr:MULTISPECIES: hypothetical protein [unclassified Mycobacterium]